MFGFQTDHFSSVVERFGYPEDDQNPNDLVWISDRKYCLKSELQSWDKKAFIYKTKL